MPLLPLSKEPAVRGFAGRYWKSKTTPSLDLASSWCEGANVARLTGSRHRLLVIDCDMDRGSDGFASWHELCHQHSYISPSPVTITPGKGAHFYFLLPPGVKIRSRTGFRPGIDIKGENSYVLVAPSRTEKGEYVFVGDPHNLTPAPEWLLQLLTAEEGPQTTQEGQDKPKAPKASKNAPTASVAPASADLVREALDGLQAKWPDEPWLDLWAGRTMGLDRNGAVRSPSARDQMLAYRLLVIGHSEAETESILSTCPAVAEPSIRGGSQPKKWAWESYRRSTISKAAQLVARHREEFKPKSAPKDPALAGRVEPLLKNVSGLDLQIALAQALVVSQMAALGGFVPVTRNIWLARLSALGFPITRRKLLTTYNPWSNRLLQHVKGTGHRATTKFSVDLEVLAQVESGQIPELWNSPRINLSSLRNVYSVCPGNSDTIISRAGRPPSELTKSILSLAQEGLSPAQIAARLGRTSNAVRVVLKRLRAGGENISRIKAGRPKGSKQSVPAPEAPKPQVPVITETFKLLQTRHPKSSLRVLHREAERLDQIVQLWQAPEDWRKLVTGYTSTKTPKSVDQTADWIAKTLAAHLIAEQPETWLDSETRGRIRELYVECLAEAEIRLVQIEKKKKDTKPSVVKVLSAAFSRLSVWQEQQATLVTEDTDVYWPEEIEDEHYYNDPGRFEIHLVENDNVPDWVTNDNPVPEAVKTVPAADLSEQIKELHLSLGMSHEEVELLIDA